MPTAANSAVWNARHPEAERLAAVLAAKEEQRIGAIRSLTFGAHLTSQWLPAKKLHLATSTSYRGYERNVQRHILPTLGRISIRRLRYQQIESLGVPTMRFHDLRHTHGSLLVKEGVPVKVVSERLGHAHIAHTLQTYQHVLPGMQADAARTAERLTNPPRPPKRKAKDNTGIVGGTTRRKAA